MKFTNTQAGPRGINTVNGPVLVEPGEAVEVEVYAREKGHVEASGWFQVEGDYTNDPEGTSSPAQAAVKDADGKDGVYIPAAEFNTMRETFERLAAENHELREQLAQLEKSNDQKPSEREDLKKQADELGLQYPPNIKTEKLKELIDEKLA